MIPLRDVIPSRTTPFVTIALIALNVARLRLRALAARAGADALLLRARPRARRTSRGPRSLTSMFLHGGWLHIGGNMLSLWIFGDNVEDRMGHGRFLVFYLLVGARRGAGADAAPTRTRRCPLDRRERRDRRRDGRVFRALPRTRASSCSSSWSSSSTSSRSRRCSSSASGSCCRSRPMVFRGPDIAQGVAVVAHAAGFAAGAAGVFLSRGRARSR